MIKFDIKLGSAHLNREAREQRDEMKPRIKGMHCRKCNRDTLIDFVDDGYGHPRYRVNACCPEFNARVIKNIKREF